jgi:hypothetical protein
MERRPQCDLYLTLPVEALLDVIYIELQTLPSQEQLGCHLLSRKRYRKPWTQREALVWIDSTHPPSVRFSRAVEGAERRVVVHAWGCLCCQYQLFTAGELTSHRFGYPATRFEMISFQNKVIQHQTTVVLHACAFSFLTHANTPPSFWASSISSIQPQFSGLQASSAKAR